MERKNNNYVRKDKHGVSAIWLHLHRDAYYAMVDVVDALLAAFSTTFWCFALCILSVLFLTENVNGYNTVKNMSEFQDE